MKNEDKNIIVDIIGQKGFGKIHFFVRNIYDLIDWNDTQNLTELFDRYLNGWLLHED